MIDGTIAGVIADSDAPTRHRANSTACPAEITSDAASRGALRLPQVIGGDLSFLKPLQQILCSRRRSRGRAANVVDGAWQLGEPCQVLSKGATSGLAGRNVGIPRAPKERGGRVGRPEMATQGPKRLVRSAPVFFGPPRQAGAGPLATFERDE